MATKAGPLMKRFTLPDGSTIILPADAILHPPLKSTGDDERDREIIRQEHKKALGGTW